MKYMKYVLGIVVILLAIIVSVFAGHLKDIKGTKAYELPDNIIVGSWLWRSPADMNNKTQEQLLSFAKREHINTIYIDVSSLLDTIESKDTEKQKAFDMALEGFVKKAKKHTIAVQALAGSVDWADADHGYIPPLLLEHILAYNRLHSDARVEGMQWDLEFYNSDAFEAGQKEATIQYFQVTEKLIQMVAADADAKQKGFKLGFTLPYWADGQNKNIEQVTRMGKTNFFGQLLIDDLTKLPDSYIAVMAYRDRAIGEGGTIAISEPLLSYADKTSVQVIIAQETDKTEEKHISYYGKGKQVFKNALREIITALGVHTSFKGIAIHHLESYVRL